jgi:hypothetical protein
MWDSAYAGDEPLVRYEILKDGKPFKKTEARPQTSLEPFFVLDALPKEAAHAYQVLVIDRANRTKASSEMVVRT